MDNSNWTVLLNMDNSTTSNDTLNNAGNFTMQRELYSQYTGIINAYIAPLVCAFGILGNILNLLVLSRKRFTTSMDSMERTVQMNLIALAVSDMLVCCIALPQTLISPSVGSNTIFSVKLLFKYVETPLANTFILTSTWLTVSMTIGRYIVVCIPLHARSIVDAKCTRAAIVSVYILSIALNLPRFWLTKIYPVRECQAITAYYHFDAVVDENTTCYIVNYTNLGRNRTFRFSYVTIVFVVGFLVPLLILIYCNANLIRALNKARKIQRQIGANITYRHQKDRLTPTLITIIIAFTVLVSPGEFFQYIVLVYGRNSRNRNFIHAITNLLTLINFSTNFVLYCAVNASFRRTLKAMFLGCINADNRRDPLNSSVRKYQTVAYTMTQTVNTNTNNHKAPIDDTDL